MAIHIFKSVPELIKAIAGDIVQIAQNAITLRGEFNVVLSGGESPKVLYQKLGSSEYRNLVDWHKTNFFFGDERYVPANDPQNNAKMARLALFDPLNIEASRIFAVNTTLPPSESAEDYAARMASCFNGKEIEFDLVLLGLGDNAHTASLFPHTGILSDKSASVKAVFLKQPNGYRITMTAPLINQAHHIAFLVYGGAKADAVQHVLEGDYDPEQYPAQLIKPEKGSLQWCLDEQAAARLTNVTRN